MSITLETDRLLLRPFTESDALMASLNSRQPKVAEEMSDMVLQDEEAGLKWINWINEKANVNQPWQVLAIVLKDVNLCIGLVGVIPQPKIHGEVEILFAVSDCYQNKGYATEAAQKLVEWFFSTKEDSYLCAIVKIKNIPSQRVVEKLGFTHLEDREIVFDGKPTMFKYYRLRCVE